MLEGDAECQVPSHVCLIGIVLNQILGQFWLNTLMWVSRIFGLDRFLSQAGFGFQELQLSYFCGSNR